ncbi:KLTH0B03982p [Lachancea thermotolerans CBS 6340]|uniref:KLTH0B03982p n=1 Tax=Lachancea thermotolerans (strain ATCC 56472 / CBS 6340 / NRRL Y-8284) TaxID=559295 RepID=C5DCL2_LACTC|nr:KLTH0B03982p [Lachancea thermotolerans CBS 6340]CAR21523.1 KLTH0B03982p [Lachancea thermotolerans CBS 6340]
MPCSFILYVPYTPCVRALRAPYTSRVLSDALLSELSGSSDVRPWLRSRLNTCSISVSLYIHLMPAYPTTPSAPNPARYPKNCEGGVSALCSWLALCDMLVRRLTAILQEAGLIMWCAGVLVCYCALAGSAGPGRYVRAASPPLYTAATGLCAPTPVPRDAEQSALAGSNAGGRARRNLKAAPQTGRQGRHNGAIYSGSIHKGYVETGTDAHT